MTDTPRSAAGSGPAGPPPRPLLLAAYAAVYFVWGSTFLAIRIGVETLPPFLMAGVRFFSAGAILYTVARLRGARRPEASRWATAAVVGGLLFLANGAMSWAEQWVASGVTALLVATGPLWMALLDWVRPGGVRPRPGVIVGMVAGFVASAVLAGPGAPGGENKVELTGAVVILLASVSWAVGSLYASRTGRPAEPPALAAGMQMLAGGALLIAVSLVFEAGRVDVRRFSPASAAALVYLTLLGSVVAFAAYSWLLQVEPLSRVATFAFVNPVIAVALGWALQGEPVTGPMLVAAAAIVAAVALINVSRHPPRRTSGDPVDGRSLATPPEPVPCGVASASCNGIAGGCDART